MRPTFPTEAPEASMKLLLSLLALCAPAIAAQAPPDRAELERALHETLDGARLVGQFTVVGADGVSRPPQTEQYAVSKLERGEDGSWVFNVSMSYGAQQHTMPVPVTIEWAGSTPMITMTEQTIPGLGTFTARVLLYQGLYSGTWKHGQFGGHMYGRIEPAAAAAEPAQPSSTAADAAAGQPAPAAEAAPDDADPSDAPPSRP
jgi:hypothetical protein